MKPGCHQPQQFWRYQEVAAGVGELANRSVGSIVLDCMSAMTTQLKIVVERHHDGYVAYPLGIKGVVVGQGDTYEEALTDVKSAITFHLQTFPELFKDALLSDESPVIDAFIVDATVAV